MRGPQRLTRSRPVLLALALLSAAGLVVAGLAPASGSASPPLPVTYHFLSSAVAAGAHQNADPPGANDWHCKPTRRHPRPVVLVHGTAGNKNTNWQTYAPLLKNNGYCVFALTYGVSAGTPPGADQFGGMDYIETSAHELRAFVRHVRRATGARKVDLVGHSQGTLMPDYYIKFLGGRRFVRRYVSLAPLWHGTALGSSAMMDSITAGYGISGTSMPFCHACPEMGAGSAFITKMRRTPLAVRGIAYTNIVTTHDELVVPYTSGIEKGMRNIVLQDGCAQDYTEHFEIASDPVAAAYVLNALDPRHPVPVPCELVLPFNGPPTGP